MIQSPDNRMLRRRTTTILGTTAAHQTQDVLSEDGTAPLLIAHLKKEWWSLGENVGGGMQVKRRKKRGMNLHLNLQFCGCRSQNCFTQV